MWSLQWSLRSIKLAPKITQLSVVFPEKWKNMSSYCPPFPVIVFQTCYMRQTSKGQRRMYHPGQTPTRLFSHYLNQLWHLWPSAPDVRGPAAVGAEDSVHGLYLQLAPFLCDESIERENKDDRGDACQSRRAQMLKKKRKIKFCQVLVRNKDTSLRHSCPIHECKVVLFVTNLPEEEKTKGDLDGSQPDSIKVDHKVHEFLSVCWNQIHNLAHGARPPGRAVYHQRLQWQQKGERRSNLSALSLT